jgi:hypothetical protein
MKKVLIITVYLALVVFVLASICNAISIPIVISAEQLPEVEAGYKEQINWPETQAMISNPDYVPEYIPNPAYPADPNAPTQIENPVYDAEIHEDIPSMRLETIVERFQSDVKQHLLNAANAGRLKIVIQETRDGFVPLTSLE